MASLARQEYVVLRTAGCLLQFLGGIACAFGLTWTGWATWHGIGTRSTEGRVIGEIAGRDAGDSHDHSRPLVEYRVAGKAYRVEGAVAWSPPLYRVGSRVRVRYHEHRPEAGVIDEFYDRWFAPLLLLGVGSVFFATGCFFPRLFGRRGP